MSANKWRPSEWVLRARRGGGGAGDGGGGDGSGGDGGGGDGSGGDGGAGDSTSGVSVVTDDNSTSGAGTATATRGKPPPGERCPVKTSIGVIVCRKNNTTGRMEAILVHKRYSYAFTEFVHGHYTRAGGVKSNRSRPVLRPISMLLDDMTREELLDIWSLDFALMWYRIWLTRDNRELYCKKNARFQSAFMRDGGVALRRLVMQARAGGVHIWEPPKGRRMNAREMDLACAVRELREETGITKNEYRILPGAKRRVSYISTGTRYVSLYYIAVANHHLANTSCPTCPKAIQSMAEVSEVRWCDIERVRLLDNPEGRLEALLAPAFRLVKHYYRGSWGRAQWAP